MRNGYLILYGTDLDDMDVKLFGTFKRAKWWVLDHAQHYIDVHGAQLVLLQDTARDNVYELRAKGGGIWTRYTIKKLEIE